MGTEDIKETFEEKTASQGNSDGGTKVFPHSIKAARDDTNEATPLSKETAVITFTEEEDPASIEVGEEARSLSEIMACFRDPEIRRKLGHCFILLMTCFSFGLGLIAQQTIGQRFVDTEWSDTFKGGFQVSLPLIVSTIGSLVMMLIPESVPLRAYLCTVGVGSVATFLLNTFSHSPYLFILYKVMIGALGASIPSVIGPYIESIAPLRLKTLVLGSLSFSVYLGIILGFFLNAATPDSPLMHIGMGAVAMLAQSFFSIFNLLTPYKRNALQNADLQDMRPLQVRKTASSSGFLALAREYAWFGIFAISVLFSNFLQQFSGVTFGLMEIASCLKDQIGNSPRLINLIIGAFHSIGFLVHIGANAVTSRFGRIKTLGVSLGLVGTGNMIAYGSTIMPLGGFTILFGLFVFIMGFNAGLAFIPTMLPYQYFNKHTKCVMISRLGGAFNGLMAFLSTYLGVNYIESAKSNGIPGATIFGIFALIVFSGLLITFLFYSDKSGLKLGTNAPNSGNNSVFTKAMARFSRVQNIFPRMRQQHQLNS